MKDGGSLSSGTGSPARSAEMTSLAVPKGIEEITPLWLTEALHSKGASSSASVIRRSAEAIAGGRGL